MKRLAQRWAVAAYGLAKNLHLAQWPIFERGFVPLYFGYKKYFEDPFERLTREYPELFIDGHILDVGANIGYTALLFSKSLTPGYRVYAFEPENSNYRLLEHEIESRNLTDRIIAVQAAVGAQDGDIDLWINPVHPADHRVSTEVFRKSPQGRGATQRVAMRSVDSFTASLTAPKVSFIKVDVQGYEEGVCQGMTKTLENNPQTVVALEYGPEWMSSLGFKPIWVIDFFTGRGYHVYTLTRRGGLEVSSREKVSEIGEKNGYVDVVFSKRQLL